MIKRRTEFAIWSCNFRGQHCHSETQRPQQCRKQPIHFITKTTAPSRYDLREQSVVSKNDRFVGLNAQVLEWHAEKMCDLKSPQRCSRNVERAVIVDSFEISFDVQFVVLSLSMKRSQDRTSLLELETRRARKQLRRVAITEVAEEVRLDVTDGKELLLTTFTHAFSAKECFVQLRVIEA